MNWNNLVFAQPVSNLRIDMESFRPWEYMVKTPFWYFSFIPFKNKCDSSPSLIDSSRTMTSDKFSKHGFSFFFSFWSFFHRVLIYLKFTDVRYRKRHTQPRMAILRRSVEKLSYEEKSWFLKNIMSLELILSHFFTLVEFSCVNFIDQIFILGLFQ